MANLDGLVVSLRGSRAYWLGGHTPFLMERGCELGADADDRASSQGDLSGSTSETLAVTQKETRACLSRLLLRYSSSTW
jgi:hypothetical protein